LQEIAGSHPGSGRFSPALLPSLPDAGFERIICETGRGKAMRILTFTIETRTGSEVRDIAIAKLIIAGWTGRDKAKMEEHIAELERLGVKQPPSTPVFYRASAARLTQAPSIEVPGTASSGEIEPFLINDGGQVLIGIASDHTEREVEAYSITVSKQMCDKPCSPKLWPMEEVKDHWDRLELTSCIEEEGRQVTYQHGTLSAMLAPKDLFAALKRERETFEPGTAMLCGTLPAHGDVRPSHSFEMTLKDPALGRSMSCRYEVVTLPVRG
jgi:hypothetical protein